MLFQYDEWMTELDWKELMESEDTRNSLPPSIWKIRRASQQPAVKMLIDGVDRIAMHTVVNELVNRYPKFLFIYLDCLWKSDCDSSEYHQMQIELFAEYDYGRMIEFLRSSVHYSIPRVYAICEIKDLVPEMVYLLGKMGDNRKALMLIINRLGDVSRVYLINSRH